jgi:carbon monoxide dehydrogenase subunit G
MTVVERSAHLRNTPEEVWSVLADFDGISAWAPNVDHSCLLTERSSGPGTVRRIQTGRTTLTESIEEWTPPSDDHQGVMTYTFGGLPPVVRSATNSWSVVRHRGGTLVSLTTTIDAGPRPPQKLVAKVLGRKMGQASDLMIDALTSFLNRCAETAPTTEPIKEKGSEP